MENNSPELKKCNGNCGMNYCDEYGCIENKPDGDVSHLLEKALSTPPPQAKPVEDWDELRKLFNDQAKADHVIGYLESNGYKLIKPSGESINNYKNAQP